MMAAGGTAIARRRRAEPLLFAPARPYAPPAHDPHEFWVEPPAQAGEPAAVYRGQLLVGCTGLSLREPPDRHAALARGLVRLLNRQMDAVDTALAAARDGSDRGPGNGVTLARNPGETKILVGRTVVLRCWGGTSGRHPLAAAIGRVLADHDFNPEAYR